MLRNWPSARMRRWAAFRRKGAKILTVLLVVVLSVVNICSTLEIAQFVAGRFRFLYRASHPDESSLEKRKTGAAMGKSQDSARFDWGIFSCVLCFDSLLYRLKGSQDADTCNCVGNLGKHVYESNHLNHW